MKLSEILSQVETLSLNGDGETEIRGIAYDSRRVKPGDLFVAIQGFDLDGHRYIDDALNRGAAAVMLTDRSFIREQGVTVLVPDGRRALALASEAFFRQPSRELKLIGVTGTNGKTSTTVLLKTIFRAAGHKTGLFGTIENTFEEEQLPAERTTPESRDLQQMLREIADRGAGYAVMEVSSHALELDRVTGCRFTGAVFTNLTQDHLDFHPDMESYFQAKKKLFTSLQNDGEKRYAVLNADDPHSQRIADETQVPVVWYGICDLRAAVRARDIHVGLNGTSFTLEYPGGQLELNLKLTGLFSVYNCLGAVAVALEEGIDPDIIRQALEETKVPGRFEPVEGTGAFAVVVDYAHTPDSLENVLQTARDIARERVIAVFGCGGDRDNSKRPLMGEIGVRLSDLAVITSDNPRTEDPWRIIGHVEEGARRAGGTFVTIENRKEAIEYAIEQARPGDLVLIAGKGHEDYQVIGTEKVPFSDLLVARDAIAGKKR